MAEQRSDLIAFLMALGAVGGYLLYRSYQTEKAPSNYPLLGATNDTTLDYSDINSFKNWGYSEYPYSNSDNFTSELYNELTRFERATGIPGPWLAAILYHEGANFQPNARNVDKGRTVAGGIAQYTRSRIADLGLELTPHEVSNLPLSEQFEMLIADYLRFSDRIGSPGELYLAHAGPAGLGKPGSFVLGDLTGNKQQKAFYDGMSGFDLLRQGNADGKITVGEITSYGDSLFREGLRNKLRQVSRPKTKQEKRDIEAAAKRKAKR